MSDTQGPIPTQPTNVNAWKSKAAGSNVTMPSGHVARLKRVGMESFLQRGMIPNVLMEPVQQAMMGNGEADLGEIARDPQAMMTFFLLLDDVAVDVFVEPKLHHILDEEGQPVERDDNLLYVDEVDAEDKMFAFQYAVGGARSVEQFRQGQEEMLATLSPSDGDVN